MKTPETNLDPKPVFTLRRILVPTDFSNESRKSFRYAVAFAKQFGAALDAITIVEPVPFMSGVEGVPIVLDASAIRASAKQTLEDWIAREVPSTVHASALVKEGRAFLEIVETAKELGSDLIVISTHGYSGLKHAFLGSNAERIVRHAPCPVLVVRQHEHDFLAKPEAKSAARSIAANGRHVEKRTAPARRSRKLAAPRR